MFTFVVLSVGTFLWEWKFVLLLEGISWNVGYHLESLWFAKLQIVLEAILTCQDELYFWNLIGSVYFIVKTELGTNTERKRQTVKKTMSNFFFDQTAKRPKKL